MEKVTLDRMYDQGGILDAITWAESQVQEYPQRPKEPRLPKKVGSAEARQFLTETEIYEKLLVEYNIEIAILKELAEDINDVIVKYIRKEAGLDSVPEQYREKLWVKAWIDGHSNGYYEVYLKLLDLVDIFL